MSGFTHESSYNESVEWYTPPSVFEALGVTFDLDPCSSTESVGPQQYGASMDAKKEPVRNLAAELLASVRAAKAAHMPCCTEHSKRCCISYYCCSLCVVTRGE